MGLYAIQVYPDQIRPVRSQTRERLMPLGGLGGTHHTMPSSPGVEWRSTSELTAAVEVWCVKSRRRKGTTMCASL
jgi:hypothetical protein